MKRRAGMTAGVLLVVSLAASFAVAEMAIRIVRGHPFAGEKADRLLVLHTQHGLRNLQVDRSLIAPADPIVTIRTDERSYLLPSFRFADPDVTIAFLGGSTTECGALDENRRFPALVGELLEQRGIRANVLNAAKSGNTSHDSINVLLNHVAADEPDVVVMMHATNDSGLLGHFGSYRQRMAEPATPGDALRLLLQEASTRSALVGAVRYWRTVRGPGRPPVRPDVPASAPRKVDAGPFVARLRIFLATARALAAEPVLMTQPLASARNQLTPEWAQDDRQRQFNEAIRRVAAEEASALIDLDAHVSGEVEDPEALFYDGMHVNDLGSQVYAEYIAARLAETLAGRE